jgi:predicted porin
LYGVLDQAVQSQALTDSISTTAGQKYVGMYAAGSTSRLGVRAERDLGGSTKAHIQIELELKPDKPKGLLNTTSNRGNFVGLSGKAGTVRMGTQETMAYETFALDANGRTEYKPQLWRLTQTKGDASSQGDRAGNSVKYITPSFSGFTLHALGALGEGNTRYQSLAIKYQQDNIKAAIVRDSTENAKGKLCAPGTNCTDGVAYDGSTVGNSNSLVWGGSDTDKVFRNIAAASYDFGPVVLNYIYAKAYTTAASKTGSLTTHTVGLKVPVDQITLALSAGTGSLDSYTTASASSLTAGDARLSDTTVGAYYAFDKSTSAYFVGSLTTIGSQSVQSGSVKTANIGLQYKF